ncbi:MAG: antitoxin AF2212-like protein [Chloroherpetonaceae bacterium]
MQPTSLPIKAIFKNGVIEPVDALELREGSELTIIVLVSDDAQEAQSFWQPVAQSALDAVWNNPSDDVYADLLKK